MIALAMLALIPVVMWLGQTLLLRAHGLPVRWRLDAGDAPRAVRTGSRVVTQLTLVTAIACYPLCIGRSPLEYYASLFPADRTALRLAHGAAASTVFLCALFAAWIASDQMRVEVHQSRRRWTRRMILLPATALLGAAVEELLFRGVVLADLARTLPELPAVSLGSLVFAAAHYVRAVKRRWTIAGHVLLGVLLCIAFWRTRDLWLSTGLHAGGILIIMGARPFVRYTGPPWLVGASIFPFAGVVGLAGTPGSATASHSMNDSSSRTDRSTSPVAMRAGRDAAEKAGLQRWADRHADAAIKCFEVREDADLADALNAGHHAVVVFASLDAALDFIWSRNAGLHVMAARGVRVELASPPDSPVWESALPAVQTSYIQWHQRSKQRKLIAGIVLSLLALIAVFILFHLLPPPA
jgi:membrane protease YdiL (CAAX protease family)